MSLVPVRLGAALLALATAGVFITAAEAAAPNTGDRVLTVISHNTDMKSPNPAMRAANDFRADVITYQELCESNKATLTGAGYHVFWREQRAAADGRCRKGNAIASRHPFSNGTVTPLMTAGGRNFKLLCIDLNGSGVPGATVCTTHFPLDYNESAAPTGRENRVAVAKVIRRELRARISHGRRVVLTGDFNDIPKSAPLTFFYKKPGGRGDFVEGDQNCLRYSCRTMQRTTSGARPIDYFFASGRGVLISGIDKVVFKNKYDFSGHHVIKGQVHFRPL